MAAQHTILLGSQLRDGRPGLLIEPVRSGLDRNAVQRSNAWVSSSSLLSVFVPLRCAERAFQVDPISTRRLTASAFMKVVMPMTALSSDFRRAVKASIEPALLQGQPALDLGGHRLGLGDRGVPEVPQLAVPGRGYQPVMVCGGQRLPR